jgi:SpoVK/Ycf46/Vps4 family AAA+-type ATPase
MPQIRQLARLFQAISDKDLEAASSIASEIAVSEEKKGHPSAAQMLNGSLHSNGLRTARPAEPVSGVMTNGNFLETALTSGAAEVQLKDAMLRPAARKTLEAVIEEAQHCTFLSSRGLRRRAKLLFVGPPGCGKSFTARAIAHELKMKLFVVRFDAVIGSFLGQTAIHLREIFRFAASRPCVLLFDEIDALGKQRGSPLHVGELDRIVIALMQELEFLETPGIVIATSNVPENLDRALWRRFDEFIRFPAPNKQEIQSYSKRIIAKFGIRSSAKILHQVSAAKSFADAEKMLEAEARRAALETLLRK